VRTLLNTIAIEPNRWTQDKVPACDLSELLPSIQASGFEHLEVWQYHFSRKSNDELKVLRAGAGQLGLDFTIAGVYPLFHLEGEEADVARREMYGVLDRAALLGVQWVKFFFGRIAAREITPRQLELTNSRAHAWINYGRREHGLSFCAELHGGTIFDPYEFGRKYIATNRDLALKVCWQPYGGDGLDRCIKIIRDLGPEIAHAHFQPSNAQGRCLLQDAELDYRQIVPALHSANAQFMPSVVFVPGGFASAEKPFSLDAALADAASEARWIDAILSSCDTPAPPQPGN
jgi:sugar phosphate isomerase/epimerase